MGAEQNTDKRVKFDFEVDFSNGGGIQGQDFRLDVDGNDISDEALADHIVWDMRLLMVGEVRILNKEIIEERHKRTTASQTNGQPHQVIDVSHPIENGMITYKGLPAPIICDYLSREESRKHYAEGTEFHIGKRSEEHTSELQSRQYLVCRLLLEKKKKNMSNDETTIASRDANTSTHVITYF